MGRAKGQTTVAVAMPGLNRRGGVAEHDPAEALTVQLTSSLRPEGVWSQRLLQASAGANRWRNHSPLPSAAFAAEQDTVLAFMALCHMAGDLEHTYEVENEVTFVRKWPRLASLAQELVRSTAADLRSRGRAPTWLDDAAARAGSEAVWVLLLSGIDHAHQILETLPADAPEEMHDWARRIGEARRSLLDANEPTPEWTEFLSHYMDSRPVVCAAGDPTAMHLTRELQLVKQRALELLDAHGLPRTDALTLACPKEGMPTGEPNSAYHGSLRLVTLNLSDAYEALGIFQTEGRASKTLVHESLHTGQRASEAVDTSELSAPRRALEELLREASTETLARELEPRDPGTYEVECTTLEALRLQYDPRMQTSPGWSSP